jgi:ABC-type nitrate/sulfonate/bicarbonate transport system permease component
MIGMFGSRLALGLPRVLRLATAVGCFFAVWELVGRYAGIFAVPPFSTIMVTLVEMIRSGELWEPTAGTLVIAGAGYVCAGVLGIAIGVTLGLSTTFRAAFEPLINAAYATPLTMFIPIIGIYLGLDSVGQIFLVLTFCVFIVIMNTAEGVRSVPVEYWELGHSLGRSKVRTVLSIILPHASPYILVGLRVSIARAIAGAITAQLLMSTTDLGLYLRMAGSSFAFDRLVAATFFIALLGIVPVMLAYWVERRLTRWQPS